MLISTRSAAAAPGFTICRDDEGVPDRLRGAVVAIGNFDGVHRGHQALIGAAREAARRRGVAAGVLTFEPHPRGFFAPDRPLFRLTPEPVKLKVLERLGIDGVFLRRFDAALAARSAASFVEEILRDEIGASAVIVGADFHFGRAREGTPALLADLCRAVGIDCTILDIVEEGERTISSSAIRADLREGDVAAANALLGYRWFVSGEVVHGAKRGRELGYPTANLALNENGALRHGIYAVRMAVAPGEVRDGVASFGRRPTFDNGASLLETFIFDFAGDLYGRVVEVEFVSWIRGEERFASVEDLIARMNLDSAVARQDIALASADGIASLIG